MKHDAFSNASDSRLRKSNAEWSDALSMLYRRAPVMAYAVTGEDRIVEVSEHWLETFGYERNEVLGRLSTDFLTDTSSNYAREIAFPNFLATGNSKNIEYDMVCKSGAVISVLVSATAYYNTDGDFDLSFAVITDVTEWRQLQKHAMIAAQRYESIVERQEELICRFDRELILTFANSAFKRYFQKSDMIGSSFLAMIPKSHHPAVRQHIGQLRPNSPSRYEHEVILADGTNGWQQWIDLAIADQSGRIVEYQSVGRDITERKHNEEKMHHLAMHDHLTGLPNLAAFEEELERVHARSIRKNYVFAIILVDVDNFKTINDQYGHKVGDDLLKEIGRRLQQAIRGHDFVARIGGDEFAILAETNEGNATFNILAERLCLHVRRTAWMANEPIWPSISIGFTVHQGSKLKLAKSRIKADEALYEAKADGRNNWKKR